MNQNLLENHPRSLCTRCNLRAPNYKVTCTFKKTLKAKIQRAFKKFPEHSIKTSYGRLEWICKECYYQDPFLITLPIKTKEEII